MTLGQQNRMRVFVTMLTLLLSLFVKDTSAQTGSVNYDNTSTSIAYSGNWSLYSAANTIGGSHHHTTQYGDEATLSFTGSTITYFYTMASNRGSQEIIIDGQSKGVFSSYADEVRRQVGRSWNLSTGSHTIKLWSLGVGQYTDLDMFSVNIASVGNGVYDNSHSQLRKFGTWSPSSYTIGTYGNTRDTSNTTQSGFRFTFTGDEVTYIYSTSNNRGKAAVTIDGSNKGVIDQYSSDLRRQIGVTYSGIGSGVHILNVVNTGSKNSSSSDYYIDVDAVIVGNVYNRTAAVNYADTWAHGRNSNYPNYGTGCDCNDCTNFLSQVLEAGGVPKIGIPSYDNQHYWYTYYILGWEGSRSWAATDWFKSHADTFHNRYLYLGNTPSAVESLFAGDVVIMDLASNNIVGPDHASVIVGWGYPEEGDQTNQWKLLRSAHCCDRKRVRWDFGLIMPNDKVWAYHVVY